jgi:hypothetical protein
MDLSAQDEQGNGGVFLDSGSLVVEGTAWSQNAGWVGISGYQLNMDTCPYQLYPANSYCVTPEVVEYSGSTYYMDRSVSIYSNRPAVQIEGGFSFGAEDSAGQIRAIFSFRNYGGSCIPTFLSYTPSCNSSSNTFNGTLSSPSCGNCVTHLQKQDTHVLFQKYDGSVWAYGDNSYGQL